MPASDASEPRRCRRPPSGDAPRTSLQSFGGHRDVIDSTARTR